MVLLCSFVPIANVQLQFLKQIYLTTGTTESKQQNLKQKKKQRKSAKQNRLDQSNMFQFLISRYADYVGVVTHQELLNKIQRMVGLG